MPEEAEEKTADAGGEHTEGQLERAEFATTRQRCRRTRQVRIDVLGKGLAHVPRQVARKSGPAELPQETSQSVADHDIDPGRLRAALFRDGGEAIVDGAGDARSALAVAALALGALLREVTLPPGSLHASESIEHHAAVPEGSTVECRARMAQRSVRAGYVWSVLETELSVGGAPVVSARATVLSPAEP